MGGLVIILYLTELKRIYGVASQGIRTYNERQAQRRAERERIREAEEAERLAREAAEEAERKAAEAAEAQHVQPLKPKHSGRQPYSRQRQWQWRCSRL